MTEKSINSSVKNGEIDIEQWLIDIALSKKELPELMKELGIESSKGSFTAKGSAKKSDTGGKSGEFSCSQLDLWEKAADLGFGY